MEYCYRNLQSDYGRDVLLRELKDRQKVFAEGTTAWTEIQKKIDQLVAEGFLAYLNR